MGRGSSKGRGSVGAGGKAVDNVMTQTGYMADLKGTPLIYGGNDGAITGATRKTLEAQEKKRQNANIESLDGSSLTKAL